MKEIVDKIIKEGYECFIVGGYVRDYLLGTNSKDIDIITNAHIEDIERIFGSIGSSYKEYFSYHIIDNNYTYDITSYRRELEYINNKPIKIEYASSLKEDLQRRDFTINTFVLDKDGKLLDILNAKKDLDNKIIKVVGNTKQKLTEDKTRIIRAIRFSCTLDFNLDDEIKDFLRVNASFLKEIPRELIKKELDKIFESNNYQKFFKLASEYNLDEYLSIKHGNIKPSYDKYGVWAQIETTLPLSNKEKKIINERKEQNYEWFKKHIYKQRLYN